MNDSPSSNSPGDEAPSGGGGIDTLIEPHRSFGPGVGTAMTAAFCGALALALAADPGLPAMVRLVIVLSGTLVTAALVAGARRLASYRGGLFLDREGRRLGVGLTGPRDLWWLNFDRLLGVRVTWRSAAGSTESADDLVWTAALELRDGADLVLVETDDRARADEVARQLAEVCGLDELSAPDERPAPRQHNVRFGVRQGGALQGLVTLFGASSLVIGAMLMLGYENHPVFAIIFAPALVLLGLCLVGATTAKRLAVEELEHSDGKWTHRYRIGSLAWGERSIELAQPRWRLRAEAVRGVCLELCAKETTLVMGTGATTRSRLNVEDLAALPRTFSAEPPTL